MNKVYLSKKGTLHFFIIWMPPFLLLIFVICRKMGFLPILDERIPANTLILPLILFWAFSLTTWFMTQYNIQSNNLKIRFGLVPYKDIPIEMIVEIYETTMANNAPSLSFDGIGIKIKNKPDIVISPTNKETFIQDLLQINPEIKVVKKKK